MVDNKPLPDPHWPFPSVPPKPWTPEEVRQYEQQQRAKVPDAPMIEGVYCG
jgi:hypothetical protein